MERRRVGLEQLGDRPFHRPLFSRRRDHYPGASAAGGRGRYGHDAFGKRSQLYERLQSGEVDRMRQRLYNQYDDPSPAERMMRFVKNMG